MWIHVPSTCCPSAPAAADSISPSAWRSQLLASSAALNTKHTAAKSWLRAWKRKSWMKRLFGRICEPSTASLGVESWIASLAATRASHSPTPASEPGRTILATCGRQLLESLARLNRICAFSRTSPATCLWGPIPYSDRLSQWATRLRPACLQRRKSAQATGASDCSFWQAVKAPGGGDRSRSGDRKDELLLGGQASMWHTMHGFGNFDKTGKRGGGCELGQEAAMWITPRTANVRGSKQRLEEGSNESIESQAAMWATPQGANADQGPKCKENYLKAKDKHHAPITLTDQMAMWQTPAQHQFSKRRQVGQAEREEPLLPAQAEMWPTAGGHEHKGTNKLGQRRGQLDEAAEQKFPSSRQAPPTSNAGKRSSKSTRRLNPRFVEWLMGWPLSFTR